MASNYEVDVYFFIIFIVVNKFDLFSNYCTDLHISENIQMENEFCCKRCSSFYELVRKAQSINI